MAKRKRTTRPSERLFAAPQRNLFEKSYQEKLEEQKKQPVECIGITFANDAKRREYFLEKKKTPRNVQITLDQIF